MLRRQQVLALALPSVLSVRNTLVSTAEITPDTGKVEEGRAMEKVSLAVLNFYILRGYVRPDLDRAIEMSRLKA